MTKKQLDNLSADLRAMEQQMEAIERRLQSAITIIELVGSEKPTEEDGF